jgi:type VI secretion system protein ImpA
VLEKADALRAHGRDLRLLVIVTRALFNERGPEGLAEGLTLLARTADLHWESVHPELRAGRPLEMAQRRIAALRSLEVDAMGWRPRIGELAGEPPEGVVGDLRCRTFFTAAEFGAVSGRDLELGALDSRTALAEAASGLPEAERTRIVREHEALVARVRGACTAQVAGPTPASMATLPEDQRARIAERTQATRAEMEALRSGIGAAVVALDELERVLAAKIGEPVTLPVLKTVLTRIQVTLDRPVAGAAPAAPPVPSAEPGAEGDPSPVAVSAAPAVPGRISSREEVTACLDRIIDFYERTEPASPIPLLARRMRRMVPMDFLMLMEDLAPSGLKEFRLLAGLADEKNEKRERSSG